MQVMVAVLRVFGPLLVAVFGPLFVRSIAGCC